VGDDIEIEGGRRLRGAVTETHDDHRLAMTFSVAGLIAEGRTTVLRPGSAAISYPGFYRELEGVRA
jgi:3-phosphoshikimate 1-carboxyvinyltransferase